MAKVGRDGWRHKKACIGGAASCSPHTVQLSHWRWLCLALVVIALASGAQNASAQEGASAEELLAEGRQLAQGGDLKGSLEKFREAHQRDADPRTLLKIASSLRELGRNAEALEAYEQYLANPKGSSRRRKEVEAAVVELAPLVGAVNISLEPAGGATLTVGERVLQVPEDGFVHIRLDAGENRLSFTREGYVSQFKQLTIEGGQEHQVSIEITPIPDYVPPEEEPSEESTAVAEVESAVEEVAVGRPRSNGLMPWEMPARVGGLGGLIGLQVDTKSRGGAGLVNLSYGFANYFDVMLGAILGKSQGASLAVRIFFLESEVTPVVSAGATMIFADGANIGLRAGGGASYALHPKLSLIGEVAVEHYPSPPSGYRSTFLVPTVAIEGRL